MRVKFYVLVINVILAAAVLLAGCAAPVTEMPTVAGAWQSRSAHPANQTATANAGTGIEPNARAVSGSGEPRVATKSNPGPRGGGATAQQTPIATVNGRAIARERMVDLLLRARGAEVLEQLIVLEAAEGLAGQRGLGVSDADVAAEYDRALRELVQPGKSGESFDRHAAEGVLASVLAPRHVSHEEFMLGMRRNALLRKLAHEEQVVTEGQVRAEFTRRYGPRVRVGIVQVPTLSDAPLSRERLSTQSKDVPGMEYLGPFSSEDDDVPGIIRESAFQLAVGQVSDTLRLESGWVVLRVEEKIPGNSKIGFDSERAALEEAVRGRLMRKAMAALYERLFRESLVKINHPILHEGFDRAYPQR